MLKNNDTICPLSCGLPIKDITKIIVHGAREHNLKNICFAIPKGSLVALTGPSGSGKSSIATDILQKECIRQYLESLGMVTDHIEKAKVNSITGLSPSIGVTQKITDFNPRSTVGTRSGILTLLRNMFAAMGYQLCTQCKQRVKQPLQDKSKLTTVEMVQDNTTKKIKKNYFDCPHCNNPLEKLKMNHFSGNTLEGACTSCKGAGSIINVAITRLLDQEKTIIDGGVRCWGQSLANYYAGIIRAASVHYQFPFDLSIPIKKYTHEQLTFLLYGITFPDFVRAHADIKAPKKVSEGNFEGIIPPLLTIYKKNPEKAPLDVKQYIIQELCTICNNTGLSRIARETTIHKITIVDLVQLNLHELLTWIHNIPHHINENEKQIYMAFSDALQKRISNLIEVGLEYLSLERTLPSLSAGESQRIKLAGLLGSELTGVLYVLDEPTTGLHPYNNAQLLKTMRMIQEAGNTVLIIEHDMDIIRQADYIIEVGPAGGNQGGQIVTTGTPHEIIARTASLTHTYLTKKTTVKQNHFAHKNNALIVRGAREHNLKNIDVIIPIQQLVVLTGVSGSGKSTFLFDIVDKAARRYIHHASTVPGKYTSIEGLDHFNRVITIDQVTIGKSKSTRSNVATYTKLFDLIRDLFASLPSAKAHGFDADAFSFNSSDERCTNCNGAGLVDIDMTFMPDIETECPICNGMRFTEELLSIHYKGCNISTILGLTVNEAIALFKEEKKIFTFLDIMRHVGLEYLTLGQSTTTLSGGEAQRIKLAAELSKSDTGNTLYLLDEPTTGLHPQEVDKLLNILKKLVSKGNTVIIIEHNLDIIGNADMIIDFGPGGGITGGHIVATGTPQDIIAHTNSLTGLCLKSYETKHEIQQ